MLIRKKILNLSTEHTLKLEEKNIRTKRYVFIEK